MNLNKIFIVGRLTRDPEQRTMPNGNSVSNFSVATNRTWTNQSGDKQEQTEFHNIVAFGKLADICNQYLNKGQLILVEGRIQTRSWEDSDGNKRYRTEIVAEGMQMGPRAGGGSKGNQESFEEINTDEIPVEDMDKPIDKKNSAKKKVSKKTGTEADEEIDVEDIPF